MNKDITITRKDIEVKGMDISYLESGKGNNEAIIFLHGMGREAEIWNDCLKRFGKDYHCIAPDLPGHGNSTKEDSYAYTPSFFAGAIADFANQLGINSFIFMGHSMGGQAAIVLSLSRPILIKKLVLAAPAGIEVFIEKDKMAIIKFAEMQVHQHMHSPAAKAQAMALFACAKGMLNESVYEHLSRLDTPTLIIFGENDEFIPNRFLHPMMNLKQMAEAAADIIPNASLVFIPGAGHYPQLDDPLKFYDEVVHFLM